MSQTINSCIGSIAKVIEPPTSKKCKPPSFAPKKVLHKCCLKQARENSLQRYREEKQKCTPSPPSIPSSVQTPIILCSSHHHEHNAFTHHLHALSSSSLPARAMCCQCDRSRCQNRQPRTFTHYIHAEPSSSLVSTSDVFVVTERSFTMQGSSTTRTHTLHPHCTIPIFGAHERCFVKRRLFMMPEPSTTRTHTKCTRVQTHVFEHERNSVSSQREASHSGLKVHVPSFIGACSNGTAGCLSVQHFLLKKMASVNLARRIMQQIAAPSTFLES